jgi:hypothetical protein
MAKLSSMMLIWEQTLKMIKKSKSIRLERKSNMARISMLKMMQ